jgi:hypothetical protein
MTTDYSVNVSGNYAINEARRKPKENEITQVPHQFLEDVNRLLAFLFYSYCKGNFFIVCNEI